MLPDYFISSLAQTLTVGGNDTSIQLSTIFTPDGQIVATADFAEFGRGILTINPITIASTEFASFSAITPTTPPTGTVTGVLRGLSFKGNNQIAANQKFNVVGTPVIISWGTHNIEDIMSIVNSNYATLLALINSTTVNGGVPASTTAMGISRSSVSPNVSKGTATITIASPAVITFASHGLTANDIVQFTTTGTLPTGILANTSYYVLAAGLTTNTFEISSTAGGTPIVTTGSQSGTQTLVYATPTFAATNDPRIPTANETLALVGNNTDIAVGTGNKFVTQTGLQHNAEKYAADTSGSSTAYLVTLSPIPTSLTDGMVIYIKLVNANTTTTPTLNVNSLGAKTIVKLNNIALSINDIGANMKCTLMYDLTNTQWVLQNPSLVASAPTSSTGIATRAGNAASGSQTIAHGLGRVPKIVTINCLYLGGSSVLGINARSYGTYDGTNTVSNSEAGSSQSGSGGSPISSTTNIISMFINNSFGQGSNVATITVDATNITLTWILNNNGGNTIFGASNFSILWAAQ